MRFVDTNIILRYLTKDDLIKALACEILFQRVREGTEEVITSVAIVAEVAYVLSSPRLGYRLSHAEIRALLLPLLTMPGLHLPEKDICLHALEIYVDHPGIDFEDALSVAAMEAAGITEIYSYDTDFDRFSGVRRLEP